MSALSRRNDMSNPLTRNFPERMLILPPSRTKTDTPHLMPLSEPAMAILKSVKQNDNEFVFPTVTGLKIANWSFHKRRLDSTLGKAMRPWRVHDLRRTCRMDCHGCGSRRI